jgi:hypothetical protein
MPCGATSGADGCPGYANRLRFIYVVLAVPGISLALLRTRSSFTRGQTPHAESELVGRRRLG